MKLVSISLAALLAAPLALAATGPLKEKAVATRNAYKDSVLFITAVIDLEVSAGDNPAKKEEKKIEVLGTVIGKDGLIVAPLSSMDVASAIDGRTVNTSQGSLKLSAKSNTKEVKIILPDGTEAPAKVVFKDADLDLAFIRPEKPEETKLVPVNIADSAKFEVFDDIIILSRLGKDLNREPLALTSEVTAIVTKPRTFGRIGATALGMPVFNDAGKFIGIGVNRISPRGEDGAAPQSTSVLLPAADLIEAAAQAK